MGYCDEIDVKQFALYLTPGIVIYSYGYLLPSMMFRWIGILMALCILVLFSVTGGDCRVDPIEDQPGKNVFERKSDRLKTRRSEHHNAVKPIYIIMVCIIMGIVIFSYGDLLPRIWRILFKCIGSLMVLGPLAAQQEDSERKSLRSKTCIPISENHLQKSCIPISENLRKNDMLDRIEVASLFIVGIVTYSYSYLMPRSLLMLFQCTGLLSMLLALAVLQDSSERKSLRSKTRRSEYHNAINPVSNGSEKIVRNSSVPVVSEDSKVSWALFKKQLAKNPLGEKKAKSLGEKKPLDVKKQGKTVQPEPDKAVKLICIIMGIVIFSYGDLLPRIWRIFFKCIGFLMVLGPSAAQQEDSERKSLRSKTCIPLSENLRKADIASLFIVGIVTYSYGYLTPRSLLMLFQCTGLSIVLFALAVLQEQSERKSLRSKTRRSEHHNAVKPVSNGSEKIVRNQTGLSKGSKVPVVSEDSKVSRALLKKQLAKNPPGKPGRGEAIAEVFGCCITMECVIKKAKSLGEKKPLDVKKHGKTVQPEPDKAPMLEAKWGGAMQTIQLCCGTRYSCFAWKPYENEAFGGQWNKSAVNVAN